MKLLSTLLSLVTFFSILFGGWYYTAQFQFWQVAHWSTLFRSIRDSLLLQGTPMPQMMQVTALTAMVSALFVLIVSLILSQRVSARTVHGGHGSKTLHGSAKFGGIKDVRSANLLVQSGVVLGKFGKQTLKHFGLEHILVFAPTRSGKGVSIVVPTLLDWTESSVVLDIKPELHRMTSGDLQRRGHRVFKFDPSKEDSHRFNPLSEVRLGTTNASSDIERLAAVLIDPYGEKADKYFAPAGYAWLCALLFHLLVKAKLEDQPVPSFADVAAFMSAKDFAVYDDVQDGAFKALCQSIIEYDHQDDEINALLNATATEMKGMPDKQRGGVIGTVSIALRVFQDPVIKQNTSVSDFTIDSLMDDDQPTSLFLVFTSDDHQRLQPLIKMMIDTIVDKLGSRMENKRKHRLLLLLDEFTSVGKLNSIARGVSFVAGFGIKLLLIIQDLNQLEEHYGKNQSIVGNCHIRVAFAPTEYSSAEQLSNMVGKTTIIQKKRSTSGSGLSASVSDSLSEVSRALMTPDEIMTMRGITADYGIPVRKHKGGQVLLFIAGRRPVLAEQDLFYKNPVLRRRTELPAAAITSETSVQTT